MNAVASLAVFMKKHVFGQSMIRRNPCFYDRSRAALGHHRPPVHDALRRHGVEPLFTR
jgi:hypothetical protein